MRTRGYRHWFVLLAALITLLPISAATVQAETLLQDEPPPTDQVYIVQQGDTLYGIARAFGIPVEQLITANGIQDPTLISPGQQLLIPLPAPQAEAKYTHIVQAGETLRAIALRYQLPVHEIAAANHCNLFCQYRACREINGAHGAIIIQPESNIAGCICCGLDLMWIFQIHGDITGKVGHFMRTIGCLLVICRNIHTGLIFHFW